jgi:hypothetical protein
MLRDRFRITLLLGIPTLLWSGIVQHMVGSSAPAFRASHIPHSRHGHVSVRRLGVS